ncbi:MAG: leucine-rich repeat domain-containing protein [Gemmatimonadota bacterium]|nr:leucine-rich repeat domain-containing protein [Gemmatimonadota bacterium]
MIFASRFGERVPVSGGDREALVALYNATDGPNWENNTNWLTEKDLSTWYGVDVQNGRVTTLFMHSNKLAGPIPPEVGNLSELKKLELVENRLTGRIPTELGRLTNLRNLDLSANQLTGSIPPELTQLNNLAWLQLGTNQLTGRIPSELGQLTNLEVLNLWENQLTGGIPPELSQLTKIRILHLSSNQLTGPIPGELAQLTNIEELSLDSNQLTDAIPPELGQLTNLESLGLSWNQLNGPLPAELGQLTKLERLSLGPNQLTGSIPPELGQLTNLETLSLSFNQLTGPLPAELGQLTNLMRLYLQRNQLTGALPPKLGRLTNLERLDLSWNQLTGPLPAELGQLTNLTELYIQVNRLGGSLRPELGQLTNLKGLDLSGNQLAGPLPAELGQLTNLTEMHIYVNRLTGLIPSELGQLTNLTSLRLSNNKDLTGPLPKSFTDLALDVLRLNGTQVCIPAAAEFQEWLEGIPDKRVTAECAFPERDALVALYNATDGPNWKNKAEWLSTPTLGEWYGVTTDVDGRVTRLDLQGNNLRGTIPHQLGGLTHLRTLNLAANTGLSGPVSTGLTRLALDSLALDGTQLCAPPHAEFHTWLNEIPNRIGVVRCTDTREDYYALMELYNGTHGSNWPNSTNWTSAEPLGEWHGVTTDARGRVTKVDLARNNLLGLIPRHLEQLTQLTSLNLGWNQLAGEIPPGFGRLTNLTELYLNSNELTGPIPPELGQLTEIEVLDLASNQLREGIPPELGRLTNLTELHLFGNKLTGPIPPELGQLTKLKVLHLGSNQLKAAIPPELGRLTNLTELYLIHNELTGPIPPELGQLSNLDRLDLGYNQLTGPIPSELGQLTSLTELFLAADQLTGPIPPELGQLTNLRWLGLSENQLSGAIPRELGQLTKLEHVNLFSNRLKEGIPSELGQLTNLRSLDLSENQLSGEMPRELGQLASLKTLDFRENRLSGAIPRDLGQLTNLESLDLSVNRLSGAIPSELGNLANLKSLNLAFNGALSGNLPNTFAGLNLETLRLDETLLCAPQDADFRAWLSGIPDSRVPGCTRIDRSTAYLTQATQSLQYPVPLVAGEPALVRVFVTAAQDADAAMPPVRATFYLDGAEVHTAEIEGQATGIPWQVNQASLLNSANALVPGSVVMPGLEMVVEIDPNRTLDPGLGIGARLPATGRTALDVRSLPPLELTLVPFLWSENPDSTVLMRTNDLSSESDLFRLTRDVLPVRDFILNVHEPVLTSVDPTSDNDGVLMSEIQVIYAMEGAKGYYMGIFREQGLSGLRGIALLSENVSLSVLDGNVIAHELGHNLSLLHAPGCGARSLDPDYPTEDGSIGAWGYDFLNETLVIPTTPDLMSYCHPQWIGEFSFSRALRHRLHGRRTYEAAAAYTSSARGLLLWGGVNGDKELFLESAFVVNAPPSLPSMDGPYRLMGEDQEGGTVFDLNFGMAEIACGGKGRVFAFILPVQPDWAGRLARISFSGPEGVVTLDGMEGPATALLLDRATGSVRGILRDWAEPAAKRAATTLGIPEPDLEVLVSRGIPDAVSWTR